MAKRYHLGFFFSPQTEVYPRACKGCPRKHFSLRRKKILGGILFPWRKETNLTNAIILFDFCLFPSRLLVRQSGKLLHVVPRLHFVDSPEWFGVAADDLFQVQKIIK